MIGLLNLDKPRGVTSAGVVARLRRSSGEKRVGHGGTLDPGAAGVLPLLFGRATVLASYAARESKEYRATVRLGAHSDTDDADGQLVPVAVPEGVDRAAVAGALVAFTGSILQRPPAYSAVHVDGERAYRLARQASREGVEPAQLEPRPVEAARVELVDFQPAVAPALGPGIELEVECGSGFYVRSLARDLGAALGTGGYLESLVRTRVGGLRLADAVSLAEAEALGERLGERLVRPAALLGSLTAVEVEDIGVPELAHGRALPAPGKREGEAFALDRGGRVLALGQVRGGRFLPHRLVELA